MIRTLALMSLVVGTCWMTALAQDPPVDPDSKGSVSFSVEVKNGVTTVTATRDASTGWNLGGVIVYALEPTGGFLYGTPVPFKGEIGQPPPKTDSVVMPLPNGTFDIWANHSISTQGPPPGSQVVGSIVSSVTVTNSTETAQTSGGVLTCSPVRVSGNAAFKASGTITYFPGWEADTENELVNFYTVPTGGGLIRKLSVAGVLGKDGKYTWTTDPNVVNVPSQLNYNLLATHGVRKKDLSTSHAIGSNWIKNK